MKMTLFSKLVWLDKKGWDEEAREMVEILYEDENNGHKSRALALLELFRRRIMDSPEQDNPYESTREE